MAKARGTAKKSSRVAPEPVAELAAAGVAGLPVDLLRELRERHGVEGVDFVRASGGAVGYTAVGLEKISDWAGVGLAPAEDLSAARGALLAVLQARPEPSREAFVQGRVLRVLASRRRLLVRLDDGREVVVSVQNNANFMPGMTLPQLRQGMLGTWLFHGPLPRRRGRW